MIIGTRTGRRRDLMTTTMVRIKRIIERMPRQRRKELMMINNDRGWIGLAAYCTSGTCEHFHWWIE